MDAYTRPNAIFKLLEKQVITEYFIVIQIKNANFVLTKDNIYDNTPIKREYSQRKKIPED